MQVVQSETQVKKYSSQERKNISKFSLSRNYQMKMKLQDN